mmetsp:Transcript_15027/g.42745  ORF Transcript_15027/g.42745 Transcript_15027/m.42745 type:complete len:242 (-) Transcript_15027:1764-2489(-)
MLSIWATAISKMTLQSSGVNATCGAPVLCQTITSAMGASASPLKILSRKSKVSDKRSKSLVFTRGFRYTSDTWVNKLSKSAGLLGASALALRNAANVAGKSSKAWYFKAKKMGSTFTTIPGHATGRAFKMLSRMSSMWPTIFEDDSATKLSLMSRSRRAQARSLSNVKIDMLVKPGWPSVSMKMEGSSIDAARRIILTSNFRVCGACKQPRTSSIPLPRFSCGDKLSNLTTTSKSSHKMPW